MTAVIQAHEIGLERIGKEVTVPDNDIARLMYYLSCVCTVIDCTDDPDIQRFITYQNWRQLSLDEQKALVALCNVISPQALENKVFFQKDALCGQFRNEFYQITQVNNQIVVAESIVIAGRTRRVNKVMVYKKEWVETYYTGPIRRLTSSFNRPVTSAVSYTRSNTNTRPITYTQPTVLPNERQHNVHNPSLNSNRLCLTFLAQSFRSHNVDVAIADLNDVDALTKAFQGAKAVFAMNPPAYSDPDLQVTAANVSEALASTIKAAKVERVVVLSSIGGERSSKPGNIRSAYTMEEVLKTSAPQVVIVRAA